MLLSRYLAHLVVFSTVSCQGANLIVVSDNCYPYYAQNGANNAILADRFLHEVAFKLWKAPKYGA